MKTINLLSDFFNHSSDASNLEATDQEILEKNFQEWFEENMQDFEFASRFLMCHLGNPKKYCPHHTAIVTNTRAEVMQGQESTAYIEDYIAD